MTAAQDGLAKYRASINDPDTPLFDLGELYCQAKVAVATRSGVSSRVVNVLDTLDPLPEEFCRNVSHGHGMPVAGAG